MARKRMSANSIKNWSDVDAVLRQLMEIDADITQVDMQMNRSIKEAKELADQAAQPLLAKRKALEADLKAFVTEHRGDLSGKTRSLNFGAVGFRQSTRLIVPTAAQADIIAWLRMRGMTDCITVKEAVNKDALKRYSYSEIEASGAQLKVSDEFWYDLSKDETALTT